MIAGAGIAGIAVAQQLAEKYGVRDVVIVDPRPPLTLTSNKSGANYRDWWPQQAMVSLTRRSIALMKELLGDGDAFAMNRRGYLYVTTDTVLADALPNMMTPYREAGCQVRIRQTSYEAASDGADVVLDPLTIRGTFPYLAANVTGAVHARNAGSVDTVGLGRHLLARAERHGVRVVRGEVIRIECCGHRVQSVVVATEHGLQQIATRRFVNAAGPFVQRIAELVGANLPVTTVLQQKVLLADPLGVVSRDAPFTICLDPQTLDWSTHDRRRLLASPETRRLVDLLPGGLHIKPDGSTLLKLGWAFNQDPSEPSWEPRCPAEFPRVVLLGATRIVPGLTAYLQDMPTPVAHDGGYYVKTPDDLPLIGPSGMDGAYVVGGLAGFGAMAACAAGEIAGAWITEKSPSRLASCFAPDRFSNPTYLAAIAQEQRVSGAL